jgi:hypothetical protein
VSMAMMANTSSIPIKVEEKITRADKKVEM